MREIKFRIWYPCEWDENDSPVHFKMFYDWAFDEYAPINNLLNSFDKGHVLMQYTGLEDKNGKKIYEGDIIKYHSTTKSIKDGQIAVKYKSGMFVPFHLIRPDLGDVVEVIGNIYENPELLKNEK